MTEELYRNNVASCPRKVKYVDPTAACDCMLAMVGRRRGWKKRLKALNVYVCRSCGYLHVGHISKTVQDIMANQM